MRAASAEDDALLPCPQRATQEPPHRDQRPRLAAAAVAPARRLRGRRGCALIYSGVHPPSRRTLIAFRWPQEARTGAIQPRAQMRQILREAHDVEIAANVCRWALAQADAHKPFQYSIEHLLANRGCVYDDHEASAQRDAQIGHENDEQAQGK